MRIIPRLDIKGPNLVKGIHLEGLRVLGKPEDFAAQYYENGADELMFQDVVASLYERNSLHDIVSRVARKIFIPLTVGGGIRTIEDIRRVLRAGADKVAINTAAVKNPEFIREAAMKFGSSTIVVAIETIRSTEGKFLAYTDNGREHTGLEVLEWAKQIERLGAGEIILTSVDKEGTGTGCDLELIHLISSTINIPVVAHGGIGNPDHVIEAVKSGADAIALSSVLHYELAAKLHEMNGSAKQEGNTEFLKSGRSFSKIIPASISAIKLKLLNESIPCRP